MGGGSQATFAVMGGNPKLGLSSVVVGGVVNPIF